MKVEGIPVARQDPPSQFALRTVLRDLELLLTDNACALADNNEVIGGDFRKRF